MTPKPPKEYLVTAMPKWDCGLYDSRFETGLSVVVKATNAKNAKGVARRTGFLNNGDYPKDMTFKLEAVEF